MLPRRHLRRTVALTVVLAAALLAQRHVAAEPVNMGQGISIVWAPAYVANSQGLWQHQGIEPNVILFPSGRAAQEALVGGGVVWSTVAETPVMFASLNGLPVRIIATMNAYDCFELAATKEIASAQDLKGKKVGYSQGTNSQVYLTRLLALIGAQPSDITAISLSPSDMVSSLSNGNIDAFIWTEPHLSQAVALDPNRFHRVRTPDVYKCYHNVVTLQSTIDNNPDVLVKSLRALMEAVDYIQAQPEAAIAIAAEAVKMDPSIAASAWKEIPFAIDLNTEELIADLEAEAKWAMEVGLAPPNAQMPDFTKVVVPDLLQAAKQQ